MPTSEIEFTLLFADETTSKINISPIAYNASSLQSLKTEVINFMNNDFNSDTAKMMLSKYGNEWIGFDTVKIITTQKTVLF